MNPNHWPVNDWGPMINMYEAILYSDQEFKPTVNWLAESLKFTGPTTAVMKLRKGVKFHDGAELTAEEFKYNMDWIKDRKNGAYTRSVLDPLKSLEAVDKYTLEWTFHHSWASFPGVMASAVGLAISPKALKKDEALSSLGRLETRVAATKKKVRKLEKKAKKAAAKGGNKAKKAAKKVAKEKKKLSGLEKALRKVQAEAEGAIPLDIHAVGTGKFMFEEARPGNYVKMKRNPNWWFGRSIGKPEMPYFDGLIVTVIPDMSVRLANLRAGKLDFLGIEASQYNLVKNDSKLDIYTAPTNHLRNFYFNLSKGPCKDIRVRKAISHAIDRKALVHGTQFGLATAASCVYPDTHWGHNPALKPVEYDPELSKRLLIEAGYADGLTITGYANNWWAGTVAQAMQNMLKNVNIDWKYDIVDTVAEDDRCKNLEYDLASYGFRGITDPDLMVSATYHPDGAWNKGRSNNKKAVALIEKARAELDTAKRQKLYWKMEKALYDNYEDVWLYYPMDVTAQSKKIGGYNREMHRQGGSGYWFSHPRWFKDGHP
ncbi:MAG: ABC transporter substrate-binding protein [Proteobacteria bacterium]|nr:ABC transporter substrate-binding protein [Pseudomonadota bacterium]